MPVRHPVDPPAETGRWGAIRRRLPNPTMLSMLGLLSLPSYLSPVFGPLRPFVWFFLLGLWPFVGLLGSMLRGGGDTDPAEQADPTDWIDMGGRGAHVRAVVSMLLVQFQPVVFVTGIAQLLGHVPILLRHRGRLPSPDSHDGEVDYRLPFDGEWTVVNGSPDCAHSHSWGILTQRYAHDFVITDAEGRTHTDDRGGPDQYYCFGEPIAAPADGVVVDSRNSHRDYHRTTGWLDPFQWSVLGNYVLIKHADEEYSLSAHLQKGSVTVAVGEAVDRGQQIGACGNSGNTTEPHLHFHVQDRSNFFLGAGLPVEFGLVMTSHPRTTETYHDRSYIHSGQRVRHRDRGEIDSRSVDATAQTPG